MTFKPFPILTLLTLPALAFLLWLGSWQLDRRAWKAELISEFEQSAESPPAALEAALCNARPAAGRLVAMDTVFPGEDELRVYGVGPEGAPGWRIFSPAMLPACEARSVVLVETGFEPLETARRGGGGRTSAASRPQALRFERPAPRGPFTPPDNPADGEFYAFNAPAMAQALELTRADLISSWWVAADDGAAPAHLTATPPERHVGYAVTWFLMAAALIAIYAVFHARAGRLRFRN